MKKKILTLALSLATAFAFIVSANADTMTTTGGKANKTWITTISRESHGGTIYRIAGNAKQQQLFKFDNVSLKVVQFCNTGSNSVRSENATNAYEISTFADAAISISSGRGSSCLTVSDDTYGHGTKTIYYNL